MKITRIKSRRPAELDVKRFRAPYSITDECPRCGAEVECHQTDDYFSYPTLGEVEEVSFYCCADAHADTDVEWTREVVLDLTITEVSR